MHRFAAPIPVRGGVAYITVKESRKHGKRIYSAELMEIKRLGGILEEAGQCPLRTSPAPSLQSQVKPGGILAGERVNPPGQPAPSFYIDNIRKLESKVNTQDEKI